MSFRNKKSVGALLGEQVCGGAKTGGQGSESEVWLQIRKTQKKAEMAAILKYTRLSQFTLLLVLSP